MHIKPIILKIFLTIIFYLIITPISLMLKIFQYDPLQIHKRNKKKTFWILRNKSRINFERK